MWGVFMRYMMVGLVILFGCNEPSDGQKALSQPLFSQIPRLSPIAILKKPRPDSALDASLTMTQTDTGPDVQTPPDSSLIDAMLVPPRDCETPQGELPEDVTVLEFHDGESVGDISEQTWMVVGQPVAEATLHESVVFELDRPARILGYAVQYGALPEDPEAALTVSLHPDFGYNGFDFWEPDPLARAQRCRGTSMPRNGLNLFYRNRLPSKIQDSFTSCIVERKRGAAWLFDGSPPNEECTDDCCSKFGQCHSAWNFPDLTYFFAGGNQNYAYNGLSLTFRYDYIVRLYIEYTDEISPEDTVFTRVPG